MRRLLPVLCGLFATAAVHAAAPRAPRPAPAQVEFFETKVRPVLVEHCFRCHAGRKHKGGLRLDSRQALLAGGDSGPALVPGRPEKSRLVHALHYGDKPKMPPGGKLPDTQVAALTAWVKMGAPWPDSAAPRPAPKAGRKVTASDRAFWSFRPVQKPAPPPVRDRGWARTPVDAFVLAKLEEKGLRPAPEADRRTLIRRVALDLTGLPPTPGEVDDFLADKRPDAYERLVERLLASPAYGERWARHWLDVARYAEDQAHTFQARKYPDGWRYRDWVVRAFNSDLPYDRFVTEQVAGDLLEDPGRAERLAALGFFALGPVYYGKAVADEWDDRVDTLTRGFLGLAVACARCHDHKFDPIPTTDYYSLAGVFASTDYKEYVLTPAGEIDDKAVSQPTDKVKPGKDKPAPRKPVLHSLTEGRRPANLRVYLRGNPANLGEEAPRRFLSVLAGDEPPPFTHGSGRLELAKAIASPDNPLTARVLVNRVWAWHFGRGIVATPGNFGALGERPTHPELLDWLAASFVEGRWSVKKLHRTILLSSTYRMSSSYDEAGARVDPDNRLLWRMNRKRLEVEPWRDAMLAVAGDLDRTLGGAPQELSAPGNVRRTLYGSVSRHNLDPVLRLFDFPDPNLTADRRAVTSVPLQGLFALNSEFLARRAKALAGRLAAEAPDDPARVNRAFLLLFARPPAERERDLALRFLSSAGPGKGKGPSAWEKYAQVLLCTNEFAFVD